jgi:hypothetical protein
MEPPDWVGGELTVLHPNREVPCHKIRSQPPLAMITRAPPMRSEPETVRSEAAVQRLSAGRSPMERQELLRPAGHSWTDLNGTLTPTACSLKRSESFGAGDSGRPTSEIWP